MYAQQGIKHDLILSFFTMCILACKCVVDLNPARDEAPHNCSLKPPHPRGMGRENPSGTCMLR